MFNTKKGGMILETMPLDYRPQSRTNIPASAIADWSVVRAPTIADADLLPHLQDSLRYCLSISFVAFFAVWALGYLLPIKVLLIGGALLGIYLAANRAVSGEIEHLSIHAYILSTGVVLVAPVAIALAACLTYQFSTQPIILKLLFCVIAWYLHTAESHALIHFYRNYRYMTVRVTDPPEIAHTTDKTLLACVLAILVFIPQKNLTMAYLLLVFASVAITFSKDPNALKRLPKALRAFALYPTYDSENMPAGVWEAGEGWLSRQIRTLLLMCSFLMLVAFSFYSAYPWTGFWASLVDLVTFPVYVDLLGAPLRYAFGVLVVPFLALWLCFCVYAPLIEEVDEIDRQVATLKYMLDDSEETELERIAQAIAQSQAVATDQFGNLIEEADMIYLGDVVNDFNRPVLIPRSTLLEHVYMLGASGSGKTSRGIMPLVLQLLGPVPSREKHIGSS